MQTNILIIILLHLKLLIINDVFSYKIINAFIQSLNDYYTLCLYLIIFYNHIANISSFYVYSLV